MARTFSVYLATVCIVSDAALYYHERVCISTLLPFFKM